MQIITLKRRENAHIGARYAEHIIDLAPSTRESPGTIRGLLLEGTHAPEGINGRKKKKPLLNYAIDVYLINLWSSGS